MFMGVKARRGRCGVPSARALALTACLACRKALYAIENKITIKKQPAIVGLRGFVPRNCQGSFAMHLTTLIVIGALYAIFFFPLYFRYADFFLLIYRFSVKAKKPQTNNFRAKINVPLIKGRDSVNKCGAVRVQAYQSCQRIFNFHR